MVDLPNGARVSITHSDDWIVVDYNVQCSGQRPPPTTCMVKSIIDSLIVKFSLDSRLYVQVLSIHWHCSVNMTR